MRMQSSLESALDLEKSSTAIPKLKLRMEA
jgi:hypothetical protein